MIRVIAMIWKWYAHAAGVLLLAVAASYGVLRVFAVDGPVIEVVAGPSNVTTQVPYGGTLSYRISTVRRASCPGTVVSTFIYRGGGPPITVLFSRPIQSTEIKQTDDATIYITLPASVFPGPWLYRAVADSACPTFSRQDVTAQFPIEVTEDHVDGNS